MPENIFFLAPRGYGGYSEYEVVLSRIKSSLEYTFKKVPSPLHVTLYIGCSNEDSIKIEAVDNSGKITAIQLVTHNYLVFLYTVLKDISNFEASPKLLIAADPRLGFLAAYLLKIKMRNSKIQVQLHGNSDLVLGRKGWPKWLRKKYARFLIKKSDSLRLVSRHQKDSFEKLIGLKIEHEIIAPVPFTVPHKSGAGDRNSIGFVGRIHAERGLSRWLEIAQVVALANLEFSFVVIGDGPKREYFLDRLKFTQREVKFLGWLNRNQLNLQLGKLGILLSTAESESYGVTLREALSAGLHVVAFENSATQELKSLFPNYVHISRDNRELTKFIVEFFGRQISDVELKEIRELFHSQNINSLAQVGESWATLINSH
jgi:glycosyltransferase involved in cell wall biosynthesis